MGGYWTRHRLLPSFILAVAIAAITGFLFVSPFVEQRASSYNAQSVYKNSDTDFIAPEPSFDQVSELPGTNGIDKVFPYYLTKTEVRVNDKSRTTTVLMSDQFQNVDMTMYNGKRLIEKASGSANNPIFADWQFCHDTGAALGDTVSFSLGGSNVEFSIAAIYETNSIYDGGAILAEITPEQKDVIAANAKSNGYSGMYISASDYNACHTYLMADYRPLGRLKDRDQFDSEDQYKLHYDAIMSSGYANEITDFKVRENDLDSRQSPLLILIGALFTLAAIIVFNALMANRGCEKGYFKKFCIPKGQNVKSYYTISFVFELIFSTALFAAAMALKIRFSREYISSGAYGIWVAIIPAAIIIGEIISLSMNNSKVAVITAKVKAEMEAKKKAEAEARAKAKAVGQQGNVSEVSAHKQ